MKEHKFIKDMWFITEDLYYGKLSVGEVITSTKQIFFFDSIEQWEIEKNKRGILPIIPETSVKEPTKMRTIRK
jgi:hypothetical protein